MHIVDLEPGGWCRRGLVEIRRGTTSWNTPTPDPGLWYFRLKVVSQSITDIRVRADIRWALMFDDHELMLEIAHRMIQIGRSDPAARLPDGRLLATVAPFKLIA